MPLPLFAAEASAFGAISPFREMGAYEALWKQAKSSFKTIADRFRNNPGARPSEFVSEEDAVNTARLVMDTLRGIGTWGVRLKGTPDYPEGLCDAIDPVELLYYQGAWDLAFSSCVAVVGARKPSPEGLARARKMARMLVEDNHTVVSGLATGVDTAAHEAAILAGGKTIAVIGTPLSRSYPAGNSDLQNKIARDHLLISQVPVTRYESQSINGNRLFFPERNKTMSALTKATIIIEAGETSGTLIQAQAAMKQGRKLFILDSCFQNKNLTWPEKYLAQGAIRVTDYDDVRTHLT